MCPPNWQYVSLKDKPTDIKRVPVATNASAKPNSFVPRVVVPRSSFHRLFLLRVLRPDRIGAALTQFVQAGMGGHAMTCHIMPTWIYEASLKLLVPVTLAHTSDARAGKDWWCYFIESREREIWQHVDVWWAICSGSLTRRGFFCFENSFGLWLFLLSRVSPGSFGSGVHRAIALRHDADLRRDHLFDADILRALPRQLNGQKQDPDRMNDFRVMRLMRQV